MTPIKERELRNLIETELNNVTTVRDRISDATRNWTPERLLNDRTAEEIASKNNHMASLQLILNKIDEESPKLEIQPKIHGMRTVVHIKEGELIIASLESDEEVSNPPISIAGSVYQCNTCGSLFLAFGAIKGYCEGCPDCRSTDICKIPIEQVESEKVINTVTYHCVTCGEEFNGLSDEEKAYCQGCPNCGSGNIYTVAPEEVEE